MLGKHLLTQLEGPHQRCGVVSPAGTMSGCLPGVLGAESERAGTRTLTLHFGLPAIMTCLPLQSPAMNQYPEFSEKAFPRIPLLFDPAFRWNSNLQCPRAFKNIK